LAGADDELDDDLAAWLLLRHDVLLRSRRRRRMSVEVVVSLELAEVVCAASNVAAGLILEQAGHLAGELRRQVICEAVRW